MSEWDACGYDRFPSVEANSEPPAGERYYVQ